MNLVLTFYISDIYSMASKAQLELELQLQRVKEITQMLGRWGGGRQQLWKQDTSPEFLVQMGSQARSNLQKDSSSARGSSLCIIGIIVLPSFSRTRGPA